MDAQTASVPLVTNVVPLPDFEDFFRAEFPGLCRALYLLVGDRLEAEDLAQEAMARTCERWARVRSMQRPQGYLFKVAFNLNHSRLRRLAMRARKDIRAQPPRDEVGAADDRLEVQLALARLTREQREAVVLVEWLDYSSEEAASVLGVAPASVRGRTHRARQLLRQHFGDNNSEATNE